jgi:hypothetical protein
MAGALIVVLTTTGSWAADSCGVFKPQVAANRTGSRTCVVAYKADDQQVSTYNGLIPVQGKGCPKAIKGFDGNIHPTFYTKFSCRGGQTCIEIPGSVFCGIN